jgi:SAM-dependent methyltransferase
MMRSFLDVLCCPGCGGSLELDDDPGKFRVTQGALRCNDCAATHPVDRGIPRFVPSENYAANFGFQWNVFRRTQLDSHSGTTISRDRFLVSTGWSPAELRGHRVLDVGCGAGRFAEIALSFGAEVVALDYSIAVDGARSNLGEHPRLHIVQADVYSMPLRLESFDFVYCLGVLQHTPDVKGALLALPRQLRSGGKLAVDVYPKMFRNTLSSKDWLRPVTKRMDPQRLFQLCQRFVPVLLPVSRFIGRLPGGRKLRRLIPVSNYEGVLPLNEAQLEEWALLDTYDMLAPAHDNPQTARTLRQWLHEAGLVDIVIERPGHLVGRARKP